MKWLPLVAITAVLLAVGASVASEPAEGDPLEEDALRALFVEFSPLYDPSSVMFRKLRYSRLTYAAWCGELNAKNVYGGYAGWHKFAVRDKRRGRPRNPGRYVHFIFPEEDGNAKQVRRACSTDKNYRRGDW